MVPVGVEVFVELDAVLKVYGNENVWVIGGAQIYDSYKHLAEELYITVINDVKEADVFAPSQQWVHENFRVVSAIVGLCSSTGVGYDFFLYRKK